AALAHRQSAEADVEELRRRTADELGRARAQVERELTRLRELQGVARAELTRIAATIRDEPPLAAPHPTRRGAPGGGPAHCADARTHGRRGRRHHHPVPIRHRRPLAREASLPRTYTRAPHQEPLVESS